MTITAKVILDSIAPNGARLTTFELTYPRFIHAELMTHRAFCIVGDAKLEFELPAGSSVGGRRVYKMSLDEFANKWLNGSKPHASRWGTIRTYDMRARLRKMRIRQYNEATGDVCLGSVIDVVDSGSQRVLRIWAGNNNIEVTPNHRMLTTNGWKLAGDLKVGSDKVLTLKRGKPQDEHTDPLRLKKINGLWRSSWQLAMLLRLKANNPNCRRCNSQLGEEVHHLVPVYDDPSKTFDSNNITLLCNSCHKSQHVKQVWQEGVQFYVEGVVVGLIEDAGQKPTYDLEIAAPFHNFFANKMVIHNSRNAASSRAIPTEKKIARIRKDCAVPSEWGMNQKGMQAAGPLEKGSAEQAHSAWLKGRDQALRTAEVLCGVRCVNCLAIRDWKSAHAVEEDPCCCGNPMGLDLHKQVANRVLEPFDHITVVLSTTKLKNHFLLRLAVDGNGRPLADPTYFELATKWKAAFDASVPQKLQVGQWHLPYVTVEDVCDVGFMEKPMDAFSVAELVHAHPRNVEVATLLKKISAARCARVSYLRQGQGDVQENITLHDRLVSGGHWAPLEHVATPMDGFKIIDTTSFKIAHRCAFCTEWFKPGNCVELDALWPGHSFRLLCMKCTYGHIHSGNFHGWAQYRKEFANEAGGD